MSRDGKNYFPPGIDFWIPVVFNGFITFVSCYYYDTYSSNIISSNIGEQKSSSSKYDANRTPVPLLVHHGFYLYGVLVFPGTANYHPPGIFPVSPYS